MEHTGRLPSCIRPNGLWALGRRRERRVRQVLREVLSRWPPVSPWPPHDSSCIPAAGANGRRTPVRISRRWM